MSVVDPVTVETTITNEVPAVTGRDVVIEFAVTANDAAGGDVPWTIDRIAPGKTSKEPLSNSQADTLRRTIQQTQSSPTGSDSLD